MRLPDATDLLLHLVKQVLQHRVVQRTNDEIPPVQGADRQPYVEWMTQKGAAAGQRLDLECVDIRCVRGRRNRSEYAGRAYSS